MASTNQNHLLEQLDDSNPVHQTLLDSSVEALKEVFRDFVFTEIQVEPLPSSRKGAPFVHNSFFYMSANKLNALVAISFSQEAIEKSIFRILGDSVIKEEDFADAAKELANILYGSMKKRMQYAGFSFGLATYNYKKLKPLTHLLDEEVRYGYEFFISSDLGPLCAKVLYDTIEFKTASEGAPKKDKTTVNSTYLDGYQAVKLGDLSADSQIDFDIFIHLRLNDKVLLYKRGGSTISEEILKRFHRHKIELFYIRNEDQSKFIDYISKKAVSLLKDQDLPMSAKQDKVESMARNMISGFFDDPDNGENYLKTSHQVVNKLIEDLLADDDPIKNVFSKLENQLKSMETHACNVQALATVMAMILGYTTEKALASIALGSLFHDIGYSKLPKELHSRDESTLSAEEFEKVKKHPLLGVDIVANSATEFSYETKLIIQQHHERHDGSGYPYGLKGFQTYELAKVVALANDVENRIRRQPETHPEEVMKAMWLQLNSPGGKIHDPQLFKRIFEKMMPQIFATH